MIELDDCGMELHLTGNRLWGDGMNVTVSMVIKAPDGETMALFCQEPHQGIGYTSFPKQERQCKAIKEFMEGHQNETIRRPTK